jgi:hypothetical protein
VYVPLTKSIKTRVSDANTEPTTPKSDGETQLNNGPMTIPISMSKSTSGIFFRLKIAEKTCAEKIKIPKNMNVCPIVLYV